MYDIMQYTFHQLAQVYINVDSSNSEDQGNFSFTVKHVEVQQQIDTKDCGLFAITFAVLFSARPSPNQI